MLRTFHLAIFLTFTLLFLPNLAIAHGENSEGTHYIHMTEEGFDPENITVQLGDTITFENLEEDERWPASNFHPTHTLYPGSDVQKCGTEDEENIFDACRGLKKGETYTFIFTQPGTWRFHDHLKPQYSGEIVVESNQIEDREIKQRDTSRSLRDRLTVAAYKVYYFLFPSKRERALQEADCSRVVHNEQDLQFWLRILGYHQALDELVKDSEVQREGEVITNCHLSAHLMGRAAYYVYGDSAFGETIDHRCQFGFFHGMLEAFLGEAGSDNVVQTMYARCLTFEDPFMRGNCEHGIGHGLTVYHDYNILKALEKCGELPHYGSRSLCTHGVFMENAFSALELATVRDHVSEWIDAKRPSFPCDYLAENGTSDDVVGMCYFIQTYLWGETVEHYQVEEVITRCSSLPETLQNDCFMGFGFSFASPPVPKSNKEVAAACEQINSEEGIRHCLAGATTILVGSWGTDYEKQKQALCELTSAYAQDTGECSRSIDEMLDWILDDRAPVE